MPTFKVFSFVKRANQNPYWQPIGVAHSHRDRRGVNLELNAMPLHGGTVILRLTEPQPGQGAEDFPASDELAADQVAEGENHE